MFSFIALDLDCFDKPVRRAKDSGSPLHVIRSSKNRDDVLLIKENERILHFTIQMISFSNHNRIIFKQI